MLAQIKDAVRATWRRLVPAPEGERGILRAGHVLLDIACGSFRLGLRAEYIGDWQHPRHQVMVAYRPDN